MADPTPQPTPNPTPAPAPAAGWKQQYGPLLMLLAQRLALVLLGALAAWLGIAPATVTVTVPAAAPAPAGGDGGTPRPNGWVDEPDQVAAVARTLPIPTFSGTPAFRDTAEPDHAYLWDASKKVLGAHIPARDQGQVGSCVSFGSACAAEYLECAQIASGTPGEFKALSQEVIYGGSRVQVGGGRLRGDGSVGAWAAKWCQQYGVVARGVYPGYDLTNYSEQTCRRFGDAGCPKELEPVARERPVKSITAVRTTEELRKSLANAYPVSVASNVGFGNRGPYVRDADGCLRASGTWPHQMCFVGYTKHPTRGWLYYVMNSWGPNWVSGPAGAGDPPPGGFYCTEATAQRMLDAGDSWAYASLTGFPARRLDWFVRAEPRPAADPFARLKPTGLEHFLAP